MAEELTVGHASTLADKQTRKFRFVDGDVEREGFVIRWDGRIVAYVNECRHIPTTLDWKENEFLSRDRCYLQCATHGALYDVATGRCLAGPPAGQNLKSLPVRIANDRIIVTIAREP